MKNLSYEELKQKAEIARATANVLELEAEEAKKKEVKKKGIEGWVGYIFESSSGLTEEFASFARDIKKHLTEIMKKEGFSLVSFSRGHFYFSAFFEKNGKYIYVSSDDVRYSVNGWYNNLLVRTAKHDKDYTGGSNDWATLQGLPEKANKLINY